MPWPQGAFDDHKDLGREWDETIERTKLFQRGGKNDRAAQNSPSAAPLRGFSDLIMSDASTDWDSPTRVSRRNIR